jgi:Ca-activated chloride channel homolog
MSIFKALLPILIIGLIFASLTTLDGNPSYGTLRGVLTDSETGKPIANAFINIVDIKFDTKSSTDGSYIIENVPVGTYRVTINSPNHHEVNIIRVVINSGRLTVIDFALNKVKSSEFRKTEAVFASAVQKFELIENEEIAEGVVVKKDALEYKEIVACDLSQPMATMQYRVDGLKAGGVARQGQWLPHGGTTPPNGEPYSGTFFKHYGVNPFVDTEDDHFSTFAIDVDDASYSVARGYIERGNLPDPASVRTEEFVNFFNYDYPAPQSDRFKVYMEGARSKFGTNCDLLRIGIKGQEIDPKNRKPAILTFVIDVSGSMGIDSRLALVKKALKILVENLKEDDLVGIAVYASRGQKILNHTSIKEKDKILLAIEQLQTSGSTYAEEGLKIGYQMASENFKKGAINRIILCSDGVGNVGRTSAEDILREIKSYVDQGITLTTVGFGMDNYNDIMMEKLGNKGNGHFAYVDNLEQAKRIFMQNLTGTLQVIAKDVKIQVDFDPEKVKSYRLLGYENRDVDDDKFRDDKEDGGEIGSGHDVTALYEVKLKDNVSGRFATVYIRYKDPDFEDEVTESSYALKTNDIKNDFNSTSTSFRLASCAAQFAEVMRESYYAKGENLDDVLTLAQELSSQMKGDDDVIEFTAMVSRAKKLWDEKELISSGN